MSDDTPAPAADESNFIDVAADIVSAYVSNNRVSPVELPALLTTMHAALISLGSPTTPADAGADKPTPAQIRKSIRPDGLVSFIDGKSYKTLRRHLTTNGMTFDEYRARYGLPHDYPVVAASYSEQRSALAKTFGLGQQRRNAAPEAVKATEASAPAPKPGTGRRPQPPSRAW